MPAAASARLTPPPFSGPKHAVRHQVALQWARRRVHRCGDRLEYVTRTRLLVLIDDKPLNRLVCQHNSLALRNCNVDSLLRSPANVALACSSQPIRARSVEQGAAWYEWRTDKVSCQHNSPHHRRPSPQRHRVAVLRRDSRRTNAPGPGLTSPRAADTPTTAPWAPSTAPPARGGPRYASR